MGFSVYTPESFMSVLSEKEIDEMFKSILLESKGTLETETRKAIETVSKSDLGKKVKCSKPKRTRNGAYLMSAYPQGKTKDGKRAGDAAFYLNYGSSHQPAKPWVDRSQKNAEKGCTEDIEKAYQKWLEQKAKEGWIDFV